MTEDNTGLKGWRKVEKQLDDAIYWLDIAATKLEAASKLYTDYKSGVL